MAHLNQMAHWNQICSFEQDQHGRNKGLVWSNAESLTLSANTRELYRWSRQHVRLMRKGDSSGNVQQVSKLFYNCDNRAVVAIVDAETSFCHRNNYTCFSDQSGLSRQTIKLI